MPGQAAAFSKAIWGPPARGGVDQFPLYRQLGVSIWETDLSWAAVAPTRPAQPTDPADAAYRWPAGLDQAIAEAARFHMRVMLQIVTSPPWANGGHGPTWAPADPRQYAAFAAAAARRYPTVHLWMVWGEPTKASNFQPLPQWRLGFPLDARTAGFAHLYAQMLDGAYGALKRASRRNLVIGGNTYATGSVDTLHWIMNLRLPNGRPPRMDLYGHNPFSYQDPTFTRHYSDFDVVEFSDLPELAGWVDRYLHRGLPLFLSEWTIPTADDEEFNFWVDPPVAARWITRAMRESRRWRRIYALGWINVYDDLPMSAGGLLTAGGIPKPSFAAFQRG